MTVAVIKIPSNPTPEQMEAFQEVMNEHTEHTNLEIEKIARDMGVSRNCAADICYLRSRSRWTQALEDELIALHKQGTPPNIFEFGVTNETKNNLMEEVKKRLLADGIDIDK